MAVMSAPNAATATTPWTSLRPSVWVKYSPMPCQPKIDSASTAPGKIAGMLNATFVAVGMSEARSAWRRTACALVSPVARAVRTKSLSIVSSSSERCRRWCAT